MSGWILSLQEAPEKLLQDNKAAVWVFTLCCQHVKHLLRFTSSSIACFCFSISWLLLLLTFPITIGKTEEELAFASANQQQCPVGSQRTLLNQRFSPSYLCLWTLVTCWCVICFSLLTIRKFKICTLSSSFVSLLQTKLWQMLCQDTKKIAFLHFGIRESTLLVTRCVYLGEERAGGDQVLFSLYSLWV